MKKHLNTLFVTTQGAYLAKDGETVAVRVEKKVCLRIPVHTLDSIVCFGNVGCSPFLMGFCAEKDVALSFLTENGRFLASVRGPVNGNVLLRRTQYRLADDLAVSASMARSFVIGKVGNCRYLLLRTLRDHGDKVDKEAISHGVDRMTASLHRLRGDLDLDETRGVEGDAARVYFQVFDHLIINNKKDFTFKGRNRRPPLDRCNCLLSFLYVLLMHDIRSALESTGLDPGVGYLHRDRPGRSGLALDMMEEFRPVVDRLALSLINRGQVRSNGFKITGSGAVLLKDKARKSVLVAYQTKKQDVVSHPFLKEKMPLGLVYHTQALLLARYLRGEMDGYPAVVWR